LYTSLHTKNTEVANLFMQMSLLSEAAGEDRFKSIAYRRATTTINELSEDIEKVWRENRLLDLPYVGEEIAKKIEEYLATGKTTFVDKLKAKVPEGALELVTLPGIGPRTAYKLAKQFGIKNLNELEGELESGRLTEALGEQTSKKLRDKIKKSKETERRMLLPEAKSLAIEVSNYMEHNHIRIVSSGSLRRGKALWMISTSLAPLRVRVIRLSDFRALKV